MLRTLPDGRLDVRSVEALPPDDLSAWIERRLRGEDTAVPDDPRQGAAQYELVGAVYEALRPSTQAEVRRILLRFLRQLEEGDDAWQGGPGDDLLLLVMQIGAPELAPPVERLVTRGTFLHGDRHDEERHARLVQALAHLGRKMTPEFWEALAPRFPVLAFSGMQMHALRRALDLLRYVDVQGEDTQEELYWAIRGLLAYEDYTLDGLRTALDEARTVLPPETVAFVEGALPELQEVGTKPKLRDYAPLRDALLRKLGCDPKPVSLAYRRRRAA